MSTEMVTSQWKLPSAERSYGRTCLSPKSPLAWMWCVYAPDLEGQGESLVLSPPCLDEGLCQSI